MFIDLTFRTLSAPVERNVALLRVNNSSSRFRSYGSEVILGRSLFYRQVAPLERKHIPLSLWAF